MTKRQTTFAIICLILATPMGTRNAQAQDKLPLQRVQTIPMPGVSGRMDHLGGDVEGGRLFAAALGDNQNSVEVIDLKAARRIFSIRGQSMPQGVFYSADFEKLFVANGKDGTVKSFRGDSFELLDSLSIGTNPDHVGYDQATKYLYVGIGIPNSRAGALSVIETRTNKQIGVIRTDSRPGGIKIEKSKPQIYVTLAGNAGLGVECRSCPGS